MTTPSHSDRSPDKKEFLRQLVEEKIDLKFWDDYEIEYVQPVLNAIAKRKTDRPAFKIVFEMLNRVLNSARIIAHLRKSCPHDFAIESNVLLRSMYDTCLQGVYLCKDPKTMDQKAEDYYDYSIIELKKRLMYLDQTTALNLNFLRNHPDRKNMEVLLKKYGKRAEDKCKEDKGFRRNWYRHDLPWLADQVGFEDEYRIFVSELHSHVHALPISLTSEPTLKNFLALYFPMNLTSRLLKSTADCLGIKFGRKIQKHLDEAMEDYWLSNRN